MSEYHILGTNWFFKKFFFLVWLSWFRWGEELKCLTHWVFAPPPQKYLATLFFLMPFLSFKSYSNFCATEHYIFSMWGNRMYEKDCNPSFCGHRHGVTCTDIMFNGGPILTWIFLPFVLIFAWSEWNVCIFTWKKSYNCTDWAVNLSC